MHKTKSSFTSTISITVFEHAYRYPVTLKFNCTKNCLAQCEELGKESDWMFLEVSPLIKEASSVLRPNGGESQVISALLGVIT